MPKHIILIIRNNFLLSKLILITLFIANNQELNSQTFTDSNLPIVIIETENRAEILDAPRIYASMKIIKRPDGSKNYVNDANNKDYIDYSGTITIEIRGSSSQNLPKKPYGFTTLSNDRSENDNVKLLGMPKENDWILNAFTFDDSMMRDYISYTMARQMGQYAAELKYCEVTINGDYKGLYALSEKIKIDSDRVDLVKISDTENTLPNISGGYLIKTDKLSSGEQNTWYANGANYIHEKPNEDDITPQQTAYIKSIFQSLDQNAQNSNILNGYPSIIDVPTFIDYILMSEITANVDAYKYSTYYHKDRGGKLRAGPIWDYNLTYGNDFFKRSITDVWQFNYGNTGANFWGDLFSNSTFKCYLSKRFNEITNTGQPLNYNNISNLIDDTATLISEAVVRENEKWHTIEDFSGEISNLKIWIQQRITWMTNNLGGYSNCDNIQTPSLVITKINYHPQESTKFPESDDLEFIEIKNTGNSTVDLTGIYLMKLGVSYQFPQNTNISAGNSIYLAGNSETFLAKYGVAPFDEFARDLSNKSHNLLLADAFGNLIDNVEYYDKSPWPETADGDGYFLKLIDENSDNNLASNWTTSNNLVLSTNRFNNNQINLTISPNPVEKKLNINSKKTVDQISIFNPLGQKIKTFKFNLKVGEISINELKKGTYFIHFKLTDGTRISTTIIKN